MLGERAAHRGCVKNMRTMRKPQSRLNRGEPENTRYQFYLAQSLRESGQYAAALDAYRHYVACGGVDEEIYFAKLMIAVLGEQIGLADAQILDAYQGAYRFRPQRAETLSRLARYHIKCQRYIQARDCAGMACSMPMTNDMVMVDRACLGLEASRRSRNGAFPFRRSRRMHPGVSKDAGRPTVARERTRAGAAQSRSLDAGKVVLSRRR